MHCLTASLLLSVVVMTQADLISDDVNKPPLSEHLYLFEVTSDASADDIKASFNGIGRPRHSFKVIAEPTYYFVVASDSVRALRQLSFPRGSVVTQYPVEHINDYFKLVGADNWVDEDKDQEDTELTMGIWNLHFPQGTPVHVFDLMMTAYGNQYKDTMKEVTPLSYVPVAYYPPKIFYFGKIEDNALQYVIKDGLDVIGGISAATVTIKHIVKFDMTPL